MAKLKIETRLKQLSDYAQSRDLKWRQQFQARDTGKFDFFKFLDKALKIQNEKYPVPNLVMNNEKKRDNYAFSGDFLKDQTEYGQINDVAQSDLKLGTTISKKSKSVKAKKVTNPKRSTMLHPSDISMQLFKDRKTK